MRLNGTHTLQATPQQIWDLLMDADVLAKITPGVSKLEPLGADKYTAISDVKLGPVKGTFKGKMEVTDKKEPESFTLLMKQNSKIGNVNATGSIILKPSDNHQTEVEFAGEAKLSGTLARTGQRVLGGVANAMTNQFFQSLQEEIKERYPVEHAGSIASDVEVTPTEPEPKIQPTPPPQRVVPTGSGSSASPTPVPMAQKEKTPQVVRDAVRTSVAQEVGLWQRLMNWLSSIFK